MSSGVQRKIRGATRANNSTLNVRTVGFRPGRIEIWNETSGYHLLWVKGMADASAVQTTDQGVRSQVSADALTPLSDGFSLGNLANLNDTTTEVLRYEVQE